MAKIPTRESNHTVMTEQIKGPKSGDLAEEPEEPEEFSGPRFRYHLPEHGACKTLRPAEEGSTEDPQQKELEEDRHAKRSPNECPGGLWNEVQHAITQAGRMVNTQARGVGEISAFNAVRETQESSMVASRAAMFSAVKVTLTFTVAAVKGPFDRIIALYILVLLDG